MTEGNGDVRELPKGWIHLKLEDVAEWGSGGTPSRKNPSYFKGNIPWIKTGELKGKYIRNTEEEITEEAISESSAKVFPKGSVAIAMYGATIGKTSILDVDASTNQACAVAKSLKEILFNEFLYYYLSSQTREFIELGKGGAQPNISQTLLKIHPICLPPLKEQERIVEKIEELFSELDQGVESLKTAQKQLKVYRQAVLKWAFEGKLTEAWRKQRDPSTLKTGEALLTQIKAERENRDRQQFAEWEEKVREWQAIGKVGKKPTKPQNLKDLSPITKSECPKLPQLPASWSWAKIGNIARIGTGVTPLKKKNEYYENGSIPWVTSGALNESYVRQASDFVTELALKETNLRIYPKHTLLVALYGEGKTRGKCSELLIESTTNQAIAAIIQDTMEGKIRPYLKCFLQKNYDEIRLKSSGGVQPNLNLSIVENTIFPICSLEEQEQIVQEIESRLSICDQLEATIIENLQKAEALRQSILKQAFEGKLVPQDPNDEPAEKLLEQIRLERQEKRSPQTPKQLKIKGI